MGWRQVLSWDVVDDAGDSLGSNLMGKTVWVKPGLDPHTGMVGKVVDNLGRFEQHRYWGVVFLGLHGLEGHIYEFEAQQLEVVA